MGEEEGTCWCLGGGEFLKDCLGVRDQQNQSAIDGNKPGPSNTCVPTWDASARCARSHEGQVDALVFLKETKASSTVGV